MTCNPVRLGALAALLLFAMPAAGQDVPELPPIDPNVPLPPLPEAEAAASVAPSARPSAQATDDDPSLKYRYAVIGLDEVGLKSRFEALSTLEQGGRIDNLAQLNRRAREDVALVDRLLRADGYYSGEVDLEVDRPEGNDSRASVTIRVAPGERYTISDVEVITTASAPRQLIVDILALKPGAPLAAAEIEAAENRLRTQLPERGYPFALVDERDIVIDHATRTAAYSVAVSLGQIATVNDIRIEGAQLISDRQLGRLARTRPGDRFDARDVEDLRRALVATGLFGSVAVRAVPADPGPDGGARVDIVASTQAAPLRTVAGQAGYSTGEGIRVEASWQHRNFVQPEGALTLRGVAGTREQRLGGELRFLNFRKRDRTLLLSAEASHEDRDAYDARTLSLGTRIERETNLIWQKKWFWSLGAELIASDETDTDLDTGMTRDRTFMIAALPSSLSYDGTDSLLDPTRGFRLSGRVSPEASLQNGAFGYLKTQIDASAYRPVSDWFVAAGRIRIGSIFGADRDRIAPSRRFYAGGGGSVRGFGYQDIGPKDIFRDPIGGRSLAEASVEARFRVFGDFGLVAFLDAGQLYTSSIPSFTDVRYGAGLGVRYYTSFGPIRVDVATPLDPQPGDAKIGVYVSIGQAF